MPPRTGNATHLIQQLPDNSFTLEQTQFSTFQPVL